MTACDMRHQEPFDFAWCETHDETFPLGGICPYRRGEVEREAVAARARGDEIAERRALDSLALDDKARES